MKRTTKTTKKGNVKTRKWKQFTYETFFKQNKKKKTKTKTKSKQLKSQ